MTAFKPFALRLEFHDPDDAEHFLQGMLVAKTNNSNPTIAEIVDGINEALMPWRQERLLDEVHARAPQPTPGPR